MTSSPRGDPGDRTASGATQSDAVPDEFDITRYIDGSAAFFGAAANVIMQLSHPPVGYGVSATIGYWPECCAP
jgi:uncharacterized protein (DUF2236 family)